jgi:ABC-2 type transport system ATP-binding protein
VERAAEPEVIVETRGLSRRFGRNTAVNDVSLQVRRGDLFGFLGPNGAGKTTTIRMLLGLLAPSAGEIRLFGEDLRANRLRLLASVGALVEEPAFYPWLSGRQNLHAFGLLAGGVSRQRVDELLELVGLGERGGDPVRVYSQGMRQRLGIAQTLLARPRLVFLDEPTNGLDPPGIEHIRGLLGHFAREEGLTVFVSSHLLHEVELMCNRVAILDRGRMVVQGEVQELLGGDGVHLELEVDDKSAAREVVKQAGLNLVGEIDAGRALVIACERADVAPLNQALIARGVAVGGLIPRRPSLEEFFRQRLGIKATGVSAPMAEAGARGES